uniref:ADP-ribosylation factor-like 14 n=1 Tax=Nothobranchius furzeri TaxID=105023 RepID=A0A8C6PAB6_NOTFU
MGHPVSKQPQVQVLLLGLDNAGKSTLLYKMKHKASVTTVPTIGFNVATLEVKFLSAVKELIYSCKLKIKHAADQRVIGLHITSQFVQKNKTLTTQS